MSTIFVYLEADARISTNSYAKNSNYGGANLATNSVYEWRSVIRPNVSAIPAGATITAVTFHLYQEGGSDTSGVETLYRLRRTFVENEVTGDRASNGEGWTTDGAESTASDRYATAAGTLTFADDQGWQECAINLSEFQELIDTENTGFLIKRTSGGTSDKTFTSREGVSVGINKAPYFEVEYEASSGQQIIIL